MNEFERQMKAELAAADRRAARENDLISRAARGEPFWLHCEHPGYNGVAELGPFESAKTATELAAARVRIAELWGALADLIARVERTGGYASPEEQDVLHWARQVLR